MAGTIKVFAAKFLRDSDVEIHSLKCYCASPDGILVPQPTGAIAKYVAQHPSFCLISADSDRIVALGLLEAEDVDPDSDLGDEGGETDAETDNSENGVAFVQSRLKEMHWDDLRKYATGLGVKFHGLRRAEVERAIVKQLATEKK